MKYTSILALCLAAASACSALAADDPIAYVEKALKAGQKNIVVPPGTYKLIPHDDVYLNLKDLKGVTIDFTGVEFVGTLNTRMLEIENCVDVTLKGLTIDYDPLPFTQGRIIAVDNEKNWTVKIIDGYPTEDIGGDFWPIQAYDKESLELVNPMRYLDRIAVTRIDKDTFRITGGQDRRGKAEGDTLRILALHEDKWLPTVGETVQIMTYDGQCPPDAKVLAVTPAGKWTDEEEAYVKALPLWPGAYTSFYTAFTIKIDRDAGLKRGDVVIGNSRCSNGGLVRNCDFGHARARGIITKGEHSLREAYETRYSIHREGRASARPRASRRLPLPYVAVQRRVLG